MLTVHDTLEEELAGFETGADDYRAKPFEIRKLDARLFALIRRSRHQVSNEKITVGDMNLDMQTPQVTRGGQNLVMPPIELKLLAILMREPLRVVSRSDRARGMG